MNYALIGCGRISSNHIKAALDNNLKISAVCDISEEAINVFLQKNNLADNTEIKKYKSHIQMLENEKIDIVSIATKSNLHASIAIDCINAGANVIIEKPIALSVKDAEEIVRLSKEKNVKVSACLQNRFNMSVQKTKQAMKDGKLGKISHGTVHVRWNRNEDYYKQAPWRGTWEQDGGMLMNQCIHSIDIFRWLMGGEIEEVYAYTKNQFHEYIETEDVALALVKFSNGSIGTIEGTVNVYPSNLEETLYIFGQTGTVKLGGKSLDTLEIWNLKDDNDDNCVYNTNNIRTGHATVFEDMIDAIKNNREPYITADDGKAAIELIYAIHKSSKEGKPVKFPINNQNIISEIIKN